MKYIIKEDKSNAMYIALAEKGRTFNTTWDINEATPFSSIAEAIDAIVVKVSVASTHNLFIPRYTIVGLKEVTTPTFVEVEL